MNPGIGSNCWWTLPNSNRKRQPACSTNPENSSQSRLRRSIRLGETTRAARPVLLPYPFLAPLTAPLPPHTSLRTKNALLRPSVLLVRRHHSGGDPVLSAQAQACGAARLEHLAVAKISRRNSGQRAVPEAAPQLAPDPATPHARARDPRPGPALLLRPAGRWQSAGHHPR